MPAINQINIAGFKSIADASLNLHRTNILIGDNASGKSNFLQAFSFLQTVINGQQHDYTCQHGGSHRLLHLGPPPANTMHFGIRFQDSLKTQNISLRLTGNDQFTIIPQPKGKAGASRTQIEAVKNWRVYHFSDTSPRSPLKKTASLHDNRFLRDDGANLPAILYRIRQTHPQEYRTIRDAVRQTIPSFDDFHLEPTPQNPDTIRLKWQRQGAEAPLDGAALSDGARRFIALAALLLPPQKMRPATIIVDEPELGLSPAAINALAAMTAAAAADTQIIMATQSPGLLNRFEPEVALLAEMCYGATTLTRAGPEQIAQWLEPRSATPPWEK